MQKQSNTSLPNQPKSLPVWVKVVAVASLAWNLFGCYRFTLGLSDDGRARMAMDMTVSQAALYFSLPGWMTLVFGMGVFGGVIAALALWMKSRFASHISTLSLLAYLALFAGDAYYGLFQAMPQQLPILLVVLSFAFVLWFTARRHKA